MTCPKCQRPVAPVDMFCGFCQAKLGTPAPAMRAGAAPRVAPAPSHGAVAPSVSPTFLGSAEEPSAVEPGGGPAAPRVPIFASVGAGEEAAEWVADARPAGFVVRAGAYLIDGALLAAWLVWAVAVAALQQLAPFLESGVPPAVWAPKIVQSHDVLLRALPLWLLVAALYAVAFLALEGATPGKMIFRLRVMRADGREIGLRQALLRELAGGLCTALTFGLAYLAVAFSGEKRGLHDRLGGTLVVRLP